MKDDKHESPLSSSPIVGECSPKGVGGICLKVRYKPGMKDWLMRVKILGWHVHADVNRRKAYRDEVVRLTKWKGIDEDIKKQVGCAKIHSFIHSLCSKHYSSI